MAGGVRKLDTVNFPDAIARFGNNITAFDNIVTDINGIVADVTDQSRWRGLGRNAFREDCDLIQRNLRDISTIMKEIRDALRDAHNNYNTTDSHVAGEFRK